MRIGVPREVVPGERRIALVPDSIRKLAGHDDLEVCVERAAAGAETDFADAEFEAAGAKLADAGEVWSSDVVVKIQPPGDAEIERLAEGGTLIATILPYAHPETVRKLAARGVTTFSMDLMPRITRAQSMDVLSAMSTITGYKAVLLAADTLPKLMPMLMTAAGTLKPARVLVLGAGVAGLQAIATARRLGAVVEATDIRAAVKEQVESLGARFVAQEGLDAGAEDAGGYAREQSEEQQQRQREMLDKHIADSDVVICTALVPGRKAPILLTRAQVEGMSAGAVVVDLAAEQGGNCELTVAGETTTHNGVRICGPTNVAAGVPVHASQMLSRNHENYLNHLIGESGLDLDLEDELTSGPLLTHGGQIVHEAVKTALEG